MTKPENISNKCDIPTKNIMQDLVKNLARIRQDFLTFLTYLVRFLQESFKILENTLVRFLTVCPGKSCMNLTDLARHF